MSIISCGFTNFADPAVRRYNIAVAVAAARAGVDDVLYDYVRRPDGPLSSMAFPGLRGTPERSIARFLAETRRALAPYGTFLGATYANMLPHRIRALVLDGVVYPPAWVNVAAFTGANRFLGTWLRSRGDIGAAKTLRAYLDLCGRASTARCAFSAGTAAATRRKWHTLLQRLKARPVGSAASKPPVAMMS